MEFKSLLLCVLIVLLAFECSIVKCYEEWLRGSKTGNDMFLHNDAKFLVGRKMLQLVGDKTSHISGGNKAADLRDSIDLESILTSSAYKNDVVAKNGRHVAKENDESEVADEVANLMQRDYRGAARRRSPIHNHQTNN